MIEMLGATPAIPCFELIAAPIIPAT